MAVSSPPPRTASEAPATRAGPAAQPAVIPESVRGLLGFGRLSVLATATARGAPSTTIVSWLCARDARRVMIALDRRGRAFRNALENPHATLEVVTEEFVGALVGRLSLASPRLRGASFPCAAFLFEVEAVVEHGSPAVFVRPATYEFVAAKAHYAERERAVLAELRSLPLDPPRAEPESA